MNKPILDADTINEYKDCIKNTDVENRFLSSVEEAAISNENVAVLNKMRENVDFYPGYLNSDRRPHEEYFIAFTIDSTSKYKWDVNGIEDVISRIIGNKPKS